MTILYQFKVNGLLQDHDLLAQPRYRRIQRPVSVGWAKSNPTCGEGRQHRAARPDVRKQVPPRQLARSVRNWSFPPQPVAGTEPAVLASGVAYVIRRDRIFLLQPSRVDEILQERYVLLGPLDRQAAFGEQNAGVVHALLAIEPRQVIERLGTLRPHVEC